MERHHRCTSLRKVVPGWNTWVDHTVKAVRWFRWSSDTPFVQVCPADIMILLYHSARLRLNHKRDVGGVLISGHRAPPLNADPLLLHI
jgi:hypothetical protein